MTSPSTLPDGLTIAVQTPGSSGSLIQITNSNITSDSSVIKKASMIPYMNVIGLGASSNLNTSDPSYIFNNSILSAGTKFINVRYNSNNTTTAIKVQYTTGELLGGGSPYTGGINASLVNRELLLGMLYLNFDSRAFDSSL